MHSATAAALVLILAVVEPVFGAITDSQYWAVPLAKFWTDGAKNDYSEKCSKPGEDFVEAEWPGWGNVGYDTNNDESTTGNTAMLCKSICQDTHNAAAMEYGPGSNTDDGYNNFCCCTGIGFTAAEKAGPYCMYDSTSKVRRTSGFPPRRRFRAQFLHDWPSFSQF